MHAHAKTASLSPGHLCFQIGLRAWPWKEPGVDATIIIKLTLIILYEDGCTDIFKAS